jgi:hypothetical protein
MSSDTCVVELDRYEFGLVLNVLNDERNRLKEKDRPTDAVDDTLLKVAKASPKRDRGRDEAR